MEHIQDVAFKLFDQHGYTNVTIAQIAEAAEIGTTTFYRLFQTKEGLFTALPAETGFHAADLDLDDLPGELRRLVRGNDWRGMRWVIEEPTVRSAVLSELDRFAAQISDALTAHGHDATTAAVHTRHLLFAVYFTSLEQWHLNDRTPAFEHYFDRALESRT